MAQKTVLYDIHLEFGGRMVEFAGWELPLHFGSQLEEHRRVRQDAGMFDASHMAILDLEGADVRTFLRGLLANDIDRLTAAGQALYGCLLNETGGVIDDLIVYRRADDRYRVVSNAATRVRVTDWVRERAAGLAVTLTPRADLGLIAVQGPNARARAGTCLASDSRGAVSDLAPFEFAETRNGFISRTGYTGEDGYEILLPTDMALNLWSALAVAGVQPCGLGARDTLRLEAGLRLSGVDMDETVTPLESGLAWTVAFAPESRPFVGREALERQREAGQLRRFVGLMLEEPGVLRGGQRVIVPDLGEGVVTSGIYSPSLERSIGFARLPPGRYEQCLVDIRGREKRVRVVDPRFLRRSSEASGPKGGG